MSKKNTRPTQGHEALVEAWNKRVGTIEVTSGAELPHLKIVFDDKGAMRAFNDTLTNLPTPQAEGEDRRRLLEDLDYRISTAYAFVAEVEQETRTPKEQAWGDRWAATLRSLANALQTARDALKATPQAEAISLPPELKGVDLLNDPLTPEQQEALASVSEAEEAPSDALVERHIEALLKLKREIPSYMGDAPKARHYQWLHDGIDAAITALRNNAPTSLQNMQTSPDGLVEELIAWMYDKAFGFRQPKAGMAMTAAYHAWRDAADELKKRLTALRSRPSGDGEGE